MKIMLMLFLSGIALFVRGGTEGIQIQTSQETTNSAGLPGNSLMSPSAEDGIPLSQFLTPDGRFDLEAARRLGYQGALNLEGFESAIDATSGEPVFRAYGTARQSDDPDDVYWDNSISPLSGVNDRIEALTIWEGQLIAGGGFTQAGDTFASHIASWDGTRWRPLGQGMDSCVYALTVYNDKLIAGGSFVSAGGTTANRVAAWDGSSWSPLGQGIDSGIVHCLAVYQDTLLIVAGEFWIDDWPSIVAWNGTSWLYLGIGIWGPGNTGGCVYALTAYDDKLIAAGRFFSSGSNVVEWNGTTWSPLGPGVGSYPENVNALTVFNGKLIAGGNFTTAGGIPAPALATWDGSTWSAMGLPGSWSITEVSSLAAHNDTLLAGMVFREDVGGILYYRAGIVSLNGSAWEPVGDDIDWCDAPTSLALYNDDLVAAGMQCIGGPTSVDYIAVKVDSSWRPLRSGGVNASVCVVGVFGDQLIAGGYFTWAGDSAANYIAAWSGSAWSPLGLGVDGGIYAMAMYHDTLIVGGKFTHAGGSPAHNVAAWDGSRWWPMGSGVNDQVNSLCVYGDQLIAGGEFSWAGTSGANSIAAWDGSVWHPLGTGIGGGEEDPEVWALTVFEGELIAGGEFVSAGGTVVHNIASWDGSDWSDVGGGTDDVVKALAVYKGELIAGGGFDWVGRLWTHGVAAWDGTVWKALSSGVGGGNNSGLCGWDSTVHALAVYDGKLFVAGEIGRFGSSTVSQVASWDGDVASPLGSGLSTNFEYYCGSADALTVYRGELIVGGSFATAGTKPAINIAQWTKRSYSCGDANGDAKVNVGDPAFLINHVFKGGPAPSPVCAGDANGDGKTNIGDGVYLAMFIFKSGPAPSQNCCP